MSYEGYTEKLCKNGHLWGNDCYSDPTPCPQCGGDFVWQHHVDQTNGEEEMADGTIHPDTTHWPLEVLRYEEQTIVCRIPIYKIPTQASGEVNGK
jgi:hypothetical protein